MLPQGMFSVAVATVLFPALSRLVARQDWEGLRALQGNGIRQIALLLIPAAAITIALPEPITRLVYERGAFDAQSTEQVSEALFWFSFSLPFSGFNLLLTRTFFSLQRPWTPTALAGVTLAINVAVSAALYEPLGIGGVVLGTVVVDRGDDGGAVVLPAPQDRRPPARHDGADDDEDPRRGRRARRGGLRHLVRPRRCARHAACSRRSSRWAARSLSGRPSTPPSCSPCASPRRARSSSCSRAAAPLLSFTSRGRPGAHPQLLDHRPHRPRQVDAGRPHPGAHPHRRPAGDARPAARQHGPGKRARASRSRPRRCASSTPPATASTTSST